MVRGRRMWPMISSGCITVDLVAGVKARVRNPARAALGDQLQLGVVDQQRGRRIGGGRGVGDVAAQRAAVLGGDAAGPAGGARPAAETRGADCVPLDLGVRGQRAERDVIVA